MPGDGELALLASHLASQQMFPTWQKSVLAATWKKFQMMTWLAI